MKALRHVKEKFRRFGRKWFVLPPREQIAAIIILALFLLGLVARWLRRV